MSNQVILKLDDELTEEILGLDQDLKQDMVIMISFFYHFNFVPVLNMIEEMHEDEESAILVEIIKIA